MQFASVFFLCFGLFDCKIIVSLCLLVDENNLIVLRPCIGTILPSDSPVNEQAHSFQNLPRFYPEHSRVRFFGFMIVICGLQLSSIGSKKGFNMLSILTFCETFRIDLVVFFGGVFSSKS